jgi:hypothetical protein
VKRHGSREERLFERATRILDGLENGFGIPILWHLALRGYAPAMVWLASTMSPNCTRAELGRLSDPYSAASLLRRAFAKGEWNGAQNLAMTYFYINDMEAYRRWLHRGARAGDADAVGEIKAFDVRKPYPLASRTRRLRPFNRAGC